jgi:hypothetical protein
MHPHRGFFALLFLLTALQGQAMDETGCLASYRIDRGSSPWRGFTSTAEEESAARTVRATALPAEGYAPLASLARFDAGGPMLLGRSEGRREVAVNAALFSALARADATRPQKEPIPIGRYADTDFRRMKPRELVEFLLVSQVVITYWHLESELCLVEESDDGTWYAASLRGSHVYFTNQRHEEGISFLIRIGLKTGQMILEFP